MNLLYGIIIGWAQQAGSKKPSFDLNLDFLFFLVGTLIILFLEACKASLWLIYSRNLSRNHENESKIWRISSAFLTKKVKIFFFNPTC